MIGGFSTIFVLGFAVTAFKYFEIYKQGVQQEWSDATPEEQISQYTFYMSRMAIISFVSLVMYKIREIMFQKTKRKIGRDVHRVTLKRVLLAPVNIFFDVTPLGKIVKIFMEDLNVFYGQVLDCPNAMFEMGSHLLVVLSMMFAIGNWNILVPMFSMMIYLGQKISKPYTYADNQLHKVGATLWTPIHSYFHESMRGKSIIRAFQQEQQIIDKQNEMLDKTTTHFIAHHSCWNWYQLRMVWLVKWIQICCVLICIKNKGIVNNVALVLLVNWSDMGWLQHFFGCYNWGQRLMCDVQRVFNLQDAPQENYEQPVDTKVQESWPEKGEIDFKDVELRYRPNTEVVLRKLNFKAVPGEKIGVVGRTGAGKSTISMALTRIVELQGGTISIDGLDISKIGIARLRSEITMIPQDPIMFEGTLKYNLDPFDESSEERMIELIKKAGLEYLLEGVSKKELKDKEEKEAKEKARKALLQDDEDEEDDDKKKDEKKDGDKDKKEDEKKDDEKKDDENKDDEKKDGEKKDDEKKDEDDGKGLKFKVQEEGKNLSVGERQLVCIIRAILRCNKIVILDEATANIDVVTEQAIQKLISEEFKGATVMCIAHRLNTIIRSDKVLVMDKGQAIEFDSPQALMANRKSVFNKMLKEIRKSEQEI